MLNTHSLNFGKGNCDIIEFLSERLTMVDIDDSRMSRENDLTDLIKYFQSNFRDRRLFRFTLTRVYIRN